MLRGKGVTEAPKTVRKGQFFTSFTVVKISYNLLHRNNIDHKSTG